MMGVRRSQYGKELEKETRKPGTLAEAHKKAAEKSKVKSMKEPKSRQRTKPSDFKETWIGRLKRKSHELLKGEKAYISDKRYKEMKAARKTKKKGGLKKYAEETGKPSFRGASGSDLAELQKRFGKKGG
jgi:hypothetical protein